MLLQSDNVGVSTKKNKTYRNTNMLLRHAVFVSLVIDLYMFVLAVINLLYCSAVKSQVETDGLCGFSFKRSVHMGEFSSDPVTTGIVSAISHTR